MASAADRATSALARRSWGGALSMLFRTTLVGSYPQAGVAHRPQEAHRALSARVRARELWRIPDALLAGAQDDATLLAIRARRKRAWTSSPTARSGARAIPNRFATALEGRRHRHPGHGARPLGTPQPGAAHRRKIRRKQAVEVEDLKFLRAHTRKAVKMTVPGPSP